MSALAECGGGGGGGGEAVQGRTVSADLAEATDAGGPGVEGVVMPLRACSASRAPPSRTGADGDNRVSLEDDSPS